jgi:hypothetical protein
MNKKYDYVDVKNCFEQRGYELLSQSYFSNKDKLVFKDKDDYLYSLSFACFTSCKIPQKFYPHNQFTINNIRLWCKTNNRPFELLSNNYVNNYTNIQWKCLKIDCGEIFECSLNSILQGRGCGICDGRQVCINNCLATKNPDLAKEWHNVLNGDITPYTVTMNSNYLAYWQCQKDSNHIWSANIYSRSNGNGCPYCSGRLPTKENNLLVDNPELCIEWDYFKNTKKPEDYTPCSERYVYWKCSFCGHSWNAQIASRNRSKCLGCKNCKSSKLEIQIAQFLEENDIRYIKYKKYEGLVGLKNGLLSYDFYLPEHNVLIEGQGQFHDGTNDYTRANIKTQQEHDKRKKEFSIKNNIKLIEIWYYEFDQIEQLLKQKLQPE